MTIKAKLWLGNTAAGSLYGDKTFTALPRIGETLSMRGYRYHVMQIIHEEHPKAEDLDWRIHIILGDLGHS